MQFHANATGFLKTHLKISKVVDGDGIFVRDLFSGEEQEIRLLGIDAPEIKRCRKLVQDERETHLPEQLLIELGHQSWEYLRNLAPIEESVSISTEGKDSLDPYGRTLAYVFLSDRTCLNEKMIEDGFAKPYDRYFCKALSEYQQLNIFAKLNRRGLYERVAKF